MHAKGRPSGLPFFSSRRSVTGHLLLVATLLGVVGVYAPGLHGPLLFDDYPNMVWNPLVAMSRLDLGSLQDAAFSLGLSYPNRGLARVTLALNYFFSDQSFDTLGFKVTNLAIHICNGLLVFALSGRLLRRYAGGVRAGRSDAGWSALRGSIPLAVAAAWMLHPIQLTSVLYIVQRMTSLSALFVFSGLLVFLAGRVRVEEGRQGGFTLMLAGLCAGVALGILCKENAVLLPFLAFLVELFFFRRATLPAQRRVRLKRFYALAVGLPLVLGLFLVAARPGIVLGAYIDRDFTPGERLLTQARVLWFYLGLMALPRVSGFALFHDDLELSTGLLSPWTTLPAVAIWLVVAVCVLWGLRRQSLWAFGILWFIVGHALESSLLGLELVHEHRNYLPSFGIVLAGVFYCARLVESAPATRRLLAPLLGLVLGVLAFATFVRAGTWADHNTLMQFMLRNHPQSYRALAAASVIDIERGLDAATVYASLQRAAARRARHVAPLIVMAKMTAGLLPLAREGRLAAVEDPGGAALPTSLLEDGLRFTPEYLERLGELLDAEIRRRLREFPIRSETTAKLNAVQECVRSRTDVCVPLLDKVVAWHELALANSRMGAVQRAVVLLSLARLYGHIGDVHRAAQYAQQVSWAHPEALGYRFHEGMLYVSLGQWERVEQLIRELESQSRWDVFRDRAIQRIREEVENARRQRSVRGES